MSVVVWRYNDRYATCLEYGLVVTFGQRAVAVVVIPGKTNHRCRLLGWQRLMKLVIIGCNIKSGNSFHGLIAKINLNKDRDKSR